MERTKWNSPISAATPKGHHEAMNIGRQVTSPTLQMPLQLRPSPIVDAIAQASNSGPEARGAVFTRREVVDFILDLIGYTTDRPLWNLSLLEPSFGGGDFVLPVLERLIEAWKLHGRAVPASRLAKCIRAVELQKFTFDATRLKVIDTLRSSGLSDKEAAALAADWLVHDDFLLSPLSSTFEFVVGNPPYVRQELVPQALMAEYRTRYDTIFDRADLYVPFIERSAKLLSPDGKLGMICADRWTKNRYGAPLRRLLSEHFHLHVYVDMVGTPAFHSNVIAYPAIFVIGREKTGKTRVAQRPEINSRSLAELSGTLLGNQPPDPESSVCEVTRISPGTQPWILDQSDEFALVRRLERDFPLLEDAGCKVGIGVATGADRAFIGQFDELDVENDRKLPLAKTQDIRSGEVRWQGLGIVNPFAVSGGLVSLDHYPRLNRYFEERKAKLMARHISRKYPSNWYRTIDRIYPDLATTPKLLIPDIKGTAHVVYEGGNLYPHHNLYFVTSKEWELEALRAVLLSGIAKLFVSAYSTRMRGGYLRFQAQYLRRIRLPFRKDVPDSIWDSLVDAQIAGDMDACNGAVSDLYRMTAGERNLLGNLSASTAQQPSGHT